jgi:hypothetical protein
MCSSPLWKLVARRGMCGVSVSRVLERKEQPRICPSVVVFKATEENLTCPSSPRLRHVLRR